MNKLTYYILSAILSVLFFSSCSDDEKAVPAAATLNAIKATSHSLEFSLTPQHADQCAWMCYKKGETAPTAEDILNEGIPADNSATSIQRAIALEAETCYIIQAAVVSQGRYLLSEALEMKTQPVYENDVPVVKLKLLEKASYRTDNEPGNGNYVIRLASGEIGKDDLPTNIGDYLVRLDLYNVADSDPWNATLPAGEYHAGEETAQIGCWDVETTNVFTRISSDPANGVVYSYVTGGTVLVQRKGDTYTIDMDIVMEDGEPFRGHFKGDIIFEKYEPETPQGTYQPFTEDQEVSFTLAQGRYYGNWFCPHADDMLLQFYHGNFNENEVLTNGYYLQLSSCYMHKLLDYNMENPPLEEGTYQVSIFGGSTQGYMQIPMTINKGQISDINGQYYPTGSYLEKVDSRTGKRYIAFLNSGTMTVTRSGENYDIAFNFQSADGLNITCNFSGALPMGNFNDNDNTKPASPMSTLKDNVTLALPEELTEIEAYYLGEYLYPGLSSWQINFYKDKDEEGKEIKSEMITIEFFTDANKGATLQEGVYTIEHKFEPMYALPGYMMFNKADILYTWYGDKRSDDETGATDILAPIKSGTMTVSKENDGYKFVFDFQDDAGYKITGEWKGTVNVVDYSNP